MPTVVRSSYPGFVDETEAALQKIASLLENYIPLFVSLQRDGSGSPQMVALRDVLKAYSATLSADHARSDLVGVQGVSGATLRTSEGDTIEPAGEPSVCPDRQKQMSIHNRVRRDPVVGWLACKINANFSATPTRILEHAFLAFSTFFGRVLKAKTGVQNAAMYLKIREVGNQW